MIDCTAQETGSHLPISRTTSFLMGTIPLTELVVAQSGQWLGRLVSFNLSLRLVSPQLRLRLNLHTQVKRRRHRLPSTRVRQVAHRKWVEEHRK